MTICARHLLEETHVNFECAGNEGSDDETVDSNDTSHDDWDDGLHDELWSHHGHGCDPRP